MKCAVISFTENGTGINRLLCRELSAAGHSCLGFATPRYADVPEIHPLEETLREWTGRMFREKDALVFIGASGIAVRSIAPYVCDKKTDPAVLVIDEQGKYVISLLSGHLGGANELAEETAEILQAEPVITTATDRQGKFAVDVFAKKNHLTICEMSLAKEVSAELVNGGQAGLYTEFPISGPVPAELCLSRDDGKIPEIGICISLSERRQPFPKTLHLVPKIITAGIGCRRGTPVEKIRTLLLDVLDQEDISDKSLCCAASIDLKADEEGILSLCREYGIPFRTFPAEILDRAEGNFTTSGFVKKITGTDNVCERSAVTAGGNLIKNKQAGEGVTVALAAGEWRAEF